MGAVWSVDDYLHTNQADAGILVKKPTVTALLMFFSAAIPRSYSSS